MKKLMFIVLAVVLAACTPESAYATRAEKLLAEINDPTSDYVMVISHRGDWRNYPENSIPAIESVIRMGADIVEIDLKMTKDSVLVLSHDRTVNRCMNGSGRIDEFTLAELKEMRLKRAHGIATDSLRIATLEEALTVCKDRILVNLDHAWLTALHAFSTPSTVNPVGTESTLRRASVAAETGERPARVPK